MTTASEDAPWGDRQLYIAPYLDAEDGYGDEGRDSPSDRRFPVSDPALANLVSSRVKDTPFHRPVLDIDFPARLVKSTTPGHCHLYLDADLTWEAYAELLRALEVAGILEAGYVANALRRGATFVRTPDTRKGQYP